MGTVGACTRTALRKNIYVIAMAMSTRVPVLKQRFHEAGVPITVKSGHNSTEQDLDVIKNSSYFRILNSDAMCNFTEAGLKEPELCKGGYPVIAPFGSDTYRNILKRDELAVSLRRKDGYTAGLAAGLGLA